MGGEVLSAKHLLLFLEKVIFLLKLNNELPR